jgi:hypothetical protein
MLAADGPLQAIEKGPAAGSELRAAGRRRTWIVRLGETGAHGDLDGFLSRFSGLAARQEGDGVLSIVDPEYGDVRFRPDGVVEAEGRVLDPAQWTIEGHAAFMAGSPSGAEMIPPAAGSSRQ